MFYVNGRTVTCGNKTVRFAFRVMKTVPFGDRLIVLLEIPDGNKTVNNICCLDGEGKRVWRSFPLEKKYPEIRVFPYEDMTLSGGRLYAFDIYCRRFELDPRTGDVLGYTITR